MPAASSSLIDPAIGQLLSAAQALNPERTATASAGRGPGSPRAPGRAPPAGNDQPESSADIGDLLREIDRDPIAIVSGWPVQAEASTQCRRPTVRFTNQSRPALCFPRLGQLRDLTGCAGSSPGNLSAVTSPKWL
jgi:hypothetical protein